MQAIPFGIHTGTALRSSWGHSRCCVTLWQHNKTPGNNTRLSQALHHVLHNWKQNTMERQLQAPRWHHSFPACRGPLTPCSQHHSAAAATATSPRLAQQRGAPETQPLLLQQCLTLGGELRHKGSGGTAVTCRLHTPTSFEPTFALPSGPASTSKQFVWSAVRAWQQGLAKSADKQKSRMWQVQPPAMSPTIARQ